MAVQPYSATAPIKALSGSQTSPGITFTGGDTDTGIYSPAANQVGITTGGTQRLLIGANGTISLANNLSVPLATASSPSIYFGTDTNTGIYSPGPDTVAISTNGTGRLFVDASGNVGIGQATVTAVFGRTVSNTGTAAATYRLAGASTSAYLFTSDGLGQGGLNQETNHPFTFGTNGLERMRLDSSGRLGLGTSSPQDLLHVEGASSPTIRLRTSTTGSTASPASMYIDFRGYNQEIRARIEAQDRRSNVLGGFLNIGTANTSNILTNAIHIDSSQRVGLGTSSPNYPFHLVGAGNYQARIEPSTTTNAASLNLGNTSGDFYIGVDSSSGSAIGSSTAYARVIWSQGAYPLVFGTNNTRAMTIDSSQRVGIGTTTPSEKLHVTGTTLAYGNGAAPFRWGDTSAVGTLTYSGSDALIQTASGSASIAFLRSSIESARIDGSGRLLVGTSSSTGTNPQLVIQGSSASNASIFLGRNTNASSIVEGNKLGFIEIGSKDGGIGAEIAATADGTWSSTSDCPSRLVFSTTADSASSLTERMRIKSDGTINFSNVAVYADNAAAKTGGLVDGDVYRTSTGDLKIVYT